MKEIPNKAPRMVLLCSEEVIWFTLLNSKRQERNGKKQDGGETTLLIVTITIHDDLNSDHGFGKVSASLRDEKNSMFFGRSLYWGVVMVTSKPQSGSWNQREDWSQGFDFWATLETIWNTVYQILSIESWYFDGIAKRVHLLEECQREVIDRGNWFHNSWLWWMLLRFEAKVWWF